MKTIKRIPATFLAVALLVFSVPTTTMVVTADVRYTLRKIVSPSEEFTASEKALADMNDDDVVNSTDVRLLLDALS